MRLSDFNDSTSASWAIPEQDQRTERAFVARLKRPSYSRWNLLPNLLHVHCRVSAVSVVLPPHSDDEMPVSLTLFRRGAFTNLDYVEGEVKLDLSSSEHIENITVKVEGSMVLEKSIEYRDKQDHDIRPQTGA